MKKRRATDLQPQPDPRGTLDGAAFLARCQATLRLLEEDLLARVRASSALDAAFAARHGAEREARRTADSREIWDRHFITQVAASWILSCVFVRTLEDRGLLTTARIAGPGATDSQQL